MRSRAPPMPGRMAPESLMASERFTTDSARSPTMQTAARMRQAMTRLWVEEMGRAGP